MADYKATAEDFAQWDKEAYIPSQEDFDEWDQEDNQSSIPPIHDGQPEGQPQGQPQAQEQQTPSKNIFGAEEPNYPGFKGLKESSTALLSNALKGGIGFLSNPVKSVGAEGLGEEFEKDPLGEAAHAAGQLGVGIAESGKDLINFGLSALTPLSEIGGIPKGGHPVKLQIPENTGLQHALGLDSNRKGDEFIKKIPDIAALAYGGTSLIKKGYKLLDKAPPLTKERKFQNALKEEEIKSKKAEDQLAKERKQIEEEQKRKYAAIGPEGMLPQGEKIGSLSPVDLDIEAIAKEAKIERLKPTAELPEEHLGEIPGPPDTQSLIDAKLSAAKKARADVKESLGILDHPTMKAGEIIQKSIKDLKKSGEDLYKSGRDILVDKKVKVDNSKEIKDITKDLNQISANEGIFQGTVSERDALQAKIDALEGESIEASDVFDLQRTLEKMAKDTRKKQYSGKANDTEFKNLGILAERYDSHAAALANRLESVGGDEVQAIFKEANKVWKTYHDLKKHSVGKPALKKGEIPSDTLLAIANKEQGNEFFQALTNVYPELKKHLLAAHVGATSVNKLLDPTTEVRKYLEALPEVADKVNSLQHALTEVKEGYRYGAREEKKYNALVKSMKDAAKRQAARKKSIQEIDKATKQAKLLRETSDKVAAKLKQEEAQGHNTSKIKEDLARRKREYYNQETKIDVLKKNLLKLGTAKLGYEAFFKKKN